MAVNDDSRAGNRQGDDVVARAADSMREITDQGWVRVHGSVLARVLRTVRPSRHVVGRFDQGVFTIATGILVNRVRATLDARGGRVRVLDVGCTVGPENELESVNVALSVQFGARIVESTEAARDLAARTVSRMLGTSFPAERVTVDLHVSDVHSA